MAAFLLLTGSLLTPGSASGQLIPEEVPLGDVLEVLAIDRDLLAVDARSGGQVSLRLRLDERRPAIAQRDVDRHAVDRHVGEEHAEPPAALRLGAPDR